MHSLMRDGCGCIIGSGGCEDVCGNVGFMEVVGGFLHRVCALRLLYQYATCGICVLCVFLFQLAI